MTKKIGLFFGSFNPIHIGHLIIANWFVEYTDLDKVWFIVSPQNPFKEKRSLLADHHRLALARIAVEDDLLKDFFFKRILGRYNKPNFVGRSIRQTSWQ